MVSDNEIILNAAKKNYDKFLVPTSMVDSKKTKRKYTNQQKADLDIKTSVNKIGEIINLSQELNTRLWDNLNNGEPFEGANELMYNDIAMLDVMSGLEIDSAKKEFAFNRAEELRILCKKYHLVDANGKQVKPNFFAHISKQKGYYNPEKKNYMKHKTSMDYLQKEVNKFRQKYHQGGYRSFVEILDNSKYDQKKVKYDQVKRVFDIIRESRVAAKEVWSKDQFDIGTKISMANEIRQNCINYIGKMKFSYSTIYYMLASIEKDCNQDIKNIIFNTLFAVPNDSFFMALRQNKRGVSELWFNRAGNISIYGIPFSRVSPQVALFAV